MIGILFLVLLLISDKLIETFINGCVIEVNIGGKHKMDTKKLREQDQPYVAEVVNYLTQKGLAVELAGGATRGDGQYDDVDLLARGSLTQVASAVFGLQKTSLGEQEHFPAKSNDGLEYQVDHIGGPTNYVGNQVEERFDIQIGNTKVDLSFKVQKDFFFDLFF